MNRRTLILGGAGAVGVAAAAGALLWPSPHPQHGAKIAADPGKSAKPALVFVGHEL
jgi:ferric-dicitrate binding protein FerR (iron transport regulator)